MKYLGPALCLVAIVINGAGLLASDYLGYKIGLALGLFGLSIWTLSVTAPYIAKLLRQIANLID